MRWRLRDSTVEDHEILTFTGAQVGLPGVFGENEPWIFQVYYPEKAPPSIGRVIVTTAVITFLATSLIFGLALFLLHRRRKALMLEVPVDTAVFASAAEGQTNIEPPSGLSPRENEVFALLLTTATPKDIAYSFNISTSAVNKHILNIYRKLNVQSRTELFAKFTPPNIIRHP
jgi:DNA-binding CsgD family transcriptional regulator